MIERNTVSLVPSTTPICSRAQQERPAPPAPGHEHALHEAGRSVPDDVSVVSVDDIALAAYASPALTTVRQPFEAMGRAAALRVIAAIEGHEAVGEIPETRPTLTIRASTAPPR